MATLEMVETSDRAIPALRALVEDLRREGVRWCSWKSNEHLAEALEGRTDLDVLVHPDDLEMLRRVAANHGAKPLLPPPRAAFPGMEHLLGRDPDSGRLFHLHVHDRLVLGQRYVKNHRLPIEAAFLRSPDILDGVPVPQPALELGVLAIRTLLKYRPRDAVKDVLKIRTPGIEGPMAVELRWLGERTSVDDVAAALAGADRGMPVGVVDRFLEAFADDPRDGRAFFSLRGELRAALRERSRSGRVRTALRSGAAAWTHRRRFRRRPPAKGMLPAAGGVTVAVVGADGAGKSTITAQISRWLGWKLRVDSF
jgi:hypothetical protein